MDALDFCSECGTRLGGKVNALAFPNPWLTSRGLGFEDADRDKPSQLTTSFIVKGGNENPIGQAVRNRVAELTFMPSRMILWVYNPFNIARRRLGALGAGNYDHRKGVGNLRSPLGYAGHGVDANGAG